MVTNPAELVGFASAFPPAELQGDLWEDYFAAHFAGVRGAERAFFAAGIYRRHAVANPRLEDLADWPTSLRMDRYLLEALPLAKQAACTALERAELRAEEVGMLLLVTCTGYGTPGVDVQLARDLDLSPATERVLLGHMGCHAAVPALRIAADYASTRGRPALVCSVELSSLHVQPASFDLGQVVIHSLFSDAAAAVCVRPAGSALRRSFALLDVAASSNLAASDQMTWEITERGFAMTLSRAVPRTIAAAVGPLVGELLERNGLNSEAIAHWAVHPGGPRVLDVVGSKLGLSPGQLALSTSTLFEHGNCSSATLLIVLEELASSGRALPGDFVVALGFGPGMSCYAALLSVT